MNFCTSCGKPLEVGAKFCTSCGNPVETSSTSLSSATVEAPQSVSPVATAPAMAPEYPSPPPQWDQPIYDQGSSTPTALIAVGIVLVILIGLGVGTTLYIRSRASNQVVATKNGNVKNSAPASPDSDTYLRNLNLSTYPGATPAAITTESTENIVSAFQTRDTPQQVIGYYKVRFPVADTTREDEKSELRARLPNGESVVIRAMQQQSRSLVYIIREP